jgi:hypothetical protein
MTTEMSVTRLSILSSLDRLTAGGADDDDVFELGEKTR